MDLRVKMQQNGTNTKNWKKSRNNLFRGKETINKAQPNILRCFEVSKKVRLMF